MKKSINKKRTSYLMLLIVLITLIGMITGCSEGEIPIPTVEDNIYIYDQDDIIDDDVEENLNKLLVELEEKSGAEFVVISVESLLNQSIENYSNYVFNTLGIGKKGEDNGLLLLFSRSDEKVRIEVGRGFEGFLNDAKCGRILDDYFVPYRESDEYTKATEMTVKAIVNVVAEELGIQGLESDLTTEDEITWVDILFVIFIIIMIILFIIAIISGGGSSSGGFSGGSFSGGGFSGGSFGGGFSGGGGASR